MRLRRYCLPLPLVWVLLAPIPALCAPRVGEPAPAFLGMGVDGHKVTLADFGGKVVVISFWATWCSPCRKELPILEGIQKAGKGQIQVIAINTESRDVFRKAAALLKELTLTLTNDEGRRGFDAYGVKGIPHLVVIGKDGRIISVRQGYDPGELEDLAAEVTAALQSSPLRDTPSQSTDAAH